MVATRVLRADSFDEDLDELRSDFPRVDEAVAGIIEIVQNDPASWDLIPGLPVRCATTGPWEGAQNLACTYLWDGENSQVTLLNIKSL